MSHCKNYSSVRHQISRLDLDDLDLSGHFDEALMVHMLVICSSFSTLILKDASINDSHIQRLSPLLMQASITDLDLSGNLISEMGALFDSSASTS